VPDTYQGNDGPLIEACVGILQDIAAGHVFCLILKDAYPINILNQVKNCPEVCRIFCATANPLEVIVAETDLGRGVVGVVDGFPPKGVESVVDRDNRKALLRKIGYKL